MKYHSHLRTASQLIEQYEGKEPFHHFLKNYFRQNKKHGSGDRRNITQLCYSYFRLGHAYEDVSREEKLIIALFLCSAGPNLLLQNLRPEWDEFAAATLEEKLRILPESPLATEIFPCLDQISDGIDATSFAFSHLSQPDLFIRIRPGMVEPVVHALEKVNMPFKWCAPSCIALQNTTPVEKILDLDRQAVIQDYSSQKTGEFLLGLRQNLEGSKVKVWDACCGSGGKSILASDIMGDVDLTVSDIRLSILKNLEKRFARAGIKKFHSFVSDLTGDKPTASTGKNKKYDLIIADAPCSGSGTWGRNPEQLCFFRRDQIDAYASTQRKIVARLVPFLHEKAFLLYMTCSVYKKENEELVNFATGSLGLHLVRQELIQGYMLRADTMFAALFSI